MKRANSIPAGSEVAIDGAFPVDLCAPITQSAGRNVLARQTRQGFIGVVAIVVLGVGLLAYGSLRDDAKPRLHKKGELPRERS